MEIEKKYYSIGEVSKLCELSASLLRFWETEFTMLKPKKNKNGVRKYTSSDIELINEIKILLKEKGFTIQGAKDQLERKKTVHKKVDSEEMIQKLESVKSFLKEIRENITKSNSNS